MKFRLELHGGPTLAQLLPLRDLLMEAKVRLPDTEMHMFLSVCVAEDLVQFSTHQTSNLTRLEDRVDPFTSTQEPIV